MGPRSVLTVRELPEAMDDWQFRHGRFRPVVQFIMDWNDQPQRRAEMLCGRVAPRGGTDGDLALVAAVVHGLCEREYRCPGVGLVAALGVSGDDVGASGRLRLGKMGGVSGTAGLRGPRHFLRGRSARSSMSGPSSEFFDAEWLEALFDEVDAELGNGEPVKVVACGGAVMVFKHDIRRTNDVDVISEPFLFELCQASETHETHAAARFPSSLIAHVPYG